MSACRRRRLLRLASSCSRPPRARADCTADRVRVTGADRSTAASRRARSTRETLRNAARETFKGRNVCRASLTSPHLIATWLHPTRPTGRVSPSVRAVRPPDSARTPTAAGRSCAAGQASILQRAYPHVDERGATCRATGQTLSEAC